MKVDRKYLRLVLCLFLFSFQKAYGEKTIIGTVSFIIGAPGDVTVQHDGESEWHHVALNDPVRDADRMKTKEESRCEVKLTDNSILRIGENSEFEFTAVAIEEKMKNVKTQLIKGNVWSNLKKRKADNRGFQIKTPTAVCAVRGTIYRIAADSTTSCLVYDGAVDVGPSTFWGQTVQPRSKSLEPVEIPGPTQVPGPYEVSLDEWISIVKGYQIRVRADGRYAKSVFDAEKDAQLNWVKWNKLLDAGLR
jgi:hypothetical protein